MSQACGGEAWPWAAPFPHAAHPCFLFQDLDKFGNEITQLARPLPVEYLIIDVSARPAAVLGRVSGWGCTGVAHLDSCPSAWHRTGTQQVLESSSSWRP